MNTTNRVYIALFMSFSLILCASSVQAKSISVPMELSQCDELTCKWSFGNGNTTTGCNSMSHKFSESGEYNVSLTVECGGFKQKTTREVNVSSGNVWVTTDWIPQNGCGDVEQTRQVYCMNNGTVVDEGKCKTTKPDSTRIVNLDTRCGEWNCQYRHYTTGNDMPWRYLWVDTRNGNTEITTLWHYENDFSHDFASNCDGTFDSLYNYSDHYCYESSAVSNVYAIGELVGKTCNESGKCKYKYEICQKPYDYEWLAGEWQPQQGCGTIEQNRTVDCVKSYDHSVVKDSLCNDGGVVKPNEERTATIYNDCEGAYWETGEWSPEHGCGETEQTRSVECVKDGEVVNESECDTSKPITSRTVELRDGCYKEHNCQFDSGYPGYNYIGGDYDQGSNVWVLWNGDSVCSTGSFNETTDYGLYECEGDYYRYFSGRLKEKNLSDDGSVSNIKYEICREPVE